MKISEIYEFEHTRNLPSEKYKIRFIHEGNWWRAYEWSAYLAHYFPNSLEEGEKLNVLKRHYIELNKDLVAVGLQLKSFGKFFPELNKDGLIFTEEYIDVDVSDFFRENDIEYENFEVYIENWKSGFKLHDKKKKKNENNEESVPELKNKVMRILKEISDYQISDKTIIENTVFLNKIQSIIKEIIN